MSSRLRESLQRTVSRVQWIAVAVVALVTVVVGGAVGASISLSSDDATSLALSRALVNELQNHASDTDEQLELKMRSELKEQASFGRELAVYKDGKSIGGVSRVIADAPRASGGCQSERVLDHTWRVCSTRASTGATVHVAASLDRLVATTRTLILALCASALFTTALFGLLSQKVVKRALTPLDALRKDVAAIRGDSRAHLSFPRRWGVPEVDSVAEAFDQLLGRVAALAEREQRFVSDASHELRTPLTRLRGQLELLASESMSPSVRSMLRAAERSCALLARTTESLLALAREKASCTEAVDLAETVADLHGELALRDDALRQRLVVRAEEEALVRGDPQLLRLAVGNLVDNALKYSSGVVVVSVTPQPGDSPGSRVEVAVVDEGPGIAEADLPRLLQPFARGTSHAVQGSGLGLALVDHVARVHGGALLIGRAISGGTRAEMTLPKWSSRSELNDESTDDRATD